MLEFSRFLVSFLSSVRAGSSEQGWGVMWRKCINFQNSPNELWLCESWICMRNEAKMSFESEILKRCDSARRRFPKKSILVFWYLISFSFSVSLCFLRVSVLDISPEWHVSEHSFIDNSISAPCHFFIRRKIVRKNKQLIHHRWNSFVDMHKNSLAFMSSLNIISSWLTVFIGPARSRDEAIEENKQNWYLIINLVRRN